MGKRSRDFEKAAAARQDAAWRGRPATERQLAMLERIGAPRSPGMTRGEASELITAHSNDNPESRRALRRAYRARRRAA